MTHPVTVRQKVPEEKLVHLYSMAKKQLKVVSRQPLIIFVNLKI